MWLPDTNVLIAYYKSQERVVNLIEKWIIEDSLRISCIVYAEFMVKPGKEEIDLLIELRQRIGLEYLSDDILEEAIKMRGFLMKKKKRVLLLDCFIAATAMVNDWTLVTRDARDFKSISGLKLKVV